jgi:hypothetical protein
VSDDDCDELEVFTLTEADVRMIERAMSPGAIYVDLDLTAYDEDGDPEPADLKQVKAVPALPDETDW